MPPPNHLNTVKGQTGYDPAAIPWVEIYLNDIRQINCVIEYNVAEGWVIRRRMTAHGQIKTGNGGEVLTYRTEGRVVVEWKAGCPFG